MALKLQGFPKMLRVRASVMALKLQGFPKMLRIGHFSA